jgi:nucleoside-diphosphate-sugar epimerase
MNVGITGATGVLGSRLTEYLAEKGLKITALIRNKEDDDARKGRIDSLIGMGVKIHNGSLNDFDSLKAFVSNIDVCIHLAAQVSFATYGSYRKNNVKGSDNLCRAILENNPSCRLIHCSTTGILVMNKIFKFLNSEYTNSKYYTEKAVEKHCTSGLKLTVIYPCMIYGPHDLNFFPVLIKYLRKNGIPVVSGGERNLPAIYIDDLCELFYLSCMNEVSVGKRYGTVKSSGIGMHEFVGRIAKKAGCPAPSKKIPRTLLMIIAMTVKFFHYLLRKPGAPGITKIVVETLSFNCKQNYEDAWNDLNWEPKIGIDEGLDLTFRWLKENSLI